MFFALALLLLSRRQRASPPLLQSTVAGSARHGTASSVLKLRRLVEAVELAAAGAAAFLVAYSRVYLRYHSVDQVRADRGWIRCARTGRKHGLSIHLMR